MVNTKSAPRNAWNKREIKGKSYANRDHSSFFFWLFCAAGGAERHVCGRGGPGQARDVGLVVSTRCAIAGSSNLRGYLSSLLLYTLRMPIHPSSAYHQYCILNACRYILSQLIITIVYRMLVRSFPVRSSAMAYSLMMHARYLKLKLRILKNTPPFPLPPCFSHLLVGVRTQSPPRYN